MIILLMSPRSKGVQPACFVMYSAESSPLLFLNTLLMFNWLNLLKMNLFFQTMFSTCIKLMAINKCNFSDVEMNGDGSLSLT